MLLFECSKILTLIPSPFPCCPVNRECLWEKTQIEKKKIKKKINPVKIVLEDNRIINILRKHKNVQYRLIPLSFLFSASVETDTEQIFISCWELNGVKKSLINSKIYGLIGIIDLNKINKWKEGVKCQSIWINTTWEEQKDINSRKHLCCPFTSTSLNDFLSFSINLIDDSNKQIEFRNNEKKISILNFKIDVFA